MKQNWYPGHMKKSLKEMKKAVSLVDLVAVLLDARIPASSKNPDLDELIGEKPRIYLLNKADLADAEETKKWKEAIEEEGHPCLIVNAKDRKVAGAIESAARRELKDEMKKKREKNIKSDRIRLMIVGVPNAGKSTLINTIAGRAGARVGDTPGVTRSNQWIRKGNLEFLDTPGVLWPKFTGEDTARRLMLTGAMKDDGADKADLAFYFLRDLRDMKPEALEKRYGFSPEGMEPLEIMEEIGRRRGALIAGGEIDYDRTASIVFDDYRKGRLGRITLEEA